MKKSDLKKFAKLIVKQGVNVQKGQPVVITAALETQDLVGFAKVIAWNIWQMDGIKFVIPNSCCTKEIIDEDLFERRIIAKPCVGCTKGDNRKHNGVYCIIKDWETHRNIRFVDMVFGGGK